MILSKKFEIDVFPSERAENKHCFTLKDSAGAKLFELKDIEADRGLMRVRQEILAILELNGLTKLLDTYPAEAEVNIFLTEEEYKNGIPRRKERFWAISPGRKGDSKTEKEILKRAAE